MTLAEISIRRPVFTIVMSLLITLFGVIGLTQLGVREYPSVDPPTISITTAIPARPPKWCRRRSPSPSKRR